MNSVLSCANYAYALGRLVHYIPSHRERHFVPCSAHFYHWRRHSGLKVRWFDGLLVGWIVGWMVRWIGGSVVRWFHGSLVRLFDGLVIQWFDGSLVR